MYLVRSMMQGPRYFSEGSKMRSSEVCRLSSSRCWWRVRLGVAFLRMNCVPSIFRKLLTRERNSRGSSLMSGSQSSFGVKSCFGLQSLSKPAKSIFVWMCFRNRSEAFLNCLGPVVCDGVGQNFRPRPRRDWSFFGGVREVQRLWQERFCGREEMR
jgi:hypothetical protein